MGEMAARGVGEDFPMIQYLQLSLFDVMPDAEIGMIGMIYIAHTVFDELEEE